MADRTIAELAAAKIAAKAALSDLKTEIASRAGEEDPPEPEE